MIMKESMMIILVTIILKLLLVNQHLILITKHAWHKNHTNKSSFLKTTQRGAFAIDLDFPLCILWVNLTLSI